MKYQTLFSPMKIGNIEVKNRVVMTAMGVDISDHDGTANEKTIAYYKERAKGGVGLIIKEYTRVNEKDGVVAARQLHERRWGLLPRAFSPGVSNTWCLSRHCPYLNPL